MTARICFNLCYCLWLGRYARTGVLRLEWADLSEWVQHEYMVMF